MPCSNQRPIRLTSRDRDLIHTVYRYRVLRREQLERLCFPSKNAANARLVRLYQHGYLARRRLPLEYGQGSSQWLYLLGGRGARLIAETEGVPLEQLAWRRTQNHVSTLFLEHTLMVNDLRICVRLACDRSAHEIEHWLTEAQLRAQRDHVWIETGRGNRRRVALVPDAYCVLSDGVRRARFFFEADRATESNGRWRQKVEAYLRYVRSGQYRQRYGSDCLRVLVVTTGEKRLGNLLRTTDQAGAKGLLWFTTLDQVAPQTVLGGAIWRVPGRPTPRVLLETPRVSPIPAPIVLYRS